MIEVGDQLAEDPRLVGVLDSAEAVLDDRLGDDLPPRQVGSCTAARLAPVDRDGLSSGEAVISLEIVSTASKPCTRAMSR